MVYSWQLAAQPSPRVPEHPGDAIGSMLHTSLKVGFLSIGLVTLRHGGPFSGGAYYFNRGRYSGATRRRMERACRGFLSMNPLRSRVLIISWIAGGETLK